MRIGFLIALFAVTALRALGGGQNSFRLSDCGHFEVGAEFLYMQPSACIDPFAVRDPRAYVSIGNFAPQVNTDQAGPQGTIESARVNFRPGFRVLASWIPSDGCYDVTGRYTWLHTTLRRTVHPNPQTGGIWAILLNSSDVTLNVNLNDPTNPFVPFVQLVLFNPIPVDDFFPNQLPAFARSVKNFRYDAADLELAARSVMGCRFWGRVFASLHYAYLYSKQTVCYQGTLHPGPQPEFDPTFPIFGLTGNLRTAFLVATARRVTNSWVIGPRVGGEAAVDIGWGIQLIGKAAVGLLAGEASLCWRDNLFWQLAGTTLELNTVLANRVTNPHAPWGSILVPEMDFRLGIGYLWKWRCGYLFQIDASYEFIDYLDMLNFGPLFREDRAILDLPIRSFTLDGLVVRVIIGY
jgi:hypothetical protein